MGKQYQLLQTQVTPDHAYLLGFLPTARENDPIGYANIVTPVVKWVGSQRLHGSAILGVRHHRTDGGLAIECERDEVVGGRSPR